MTRTLMIFLAAVIAAEAVAAPPRFWSLPQLAEPLDTLCGLPLPWTHDGGVRFDADANQWRLRVDPDADDTMTGYLFTASGPTFNVDVVGVMHAERHADTLVLTIHGDNGDHHRLTFQWADAFSNDVPPPDPPGPTDPETPPDPGSDPPGTGPPGWNCPGGLARCDADIWACCPAGTRASCVSCRTDHARCDCLVIRDEDTPPAVTLTAYTFEAPPAD